MNDLLTYYNINQETNIDKVLNAKITNYYDIEVQYNENIEIFTNNLINKAFNTFMLYWKFANIKNIIFFYQNLNTYSYLTLQLLLAAKGFLTNVNIYIITDKRILSKNERQYFKNLSKKKCIKIISLRKAIKLKNSLLVTGFNPICNVVNFNYFSKTFIDIYNPIEHFTPKSIKQMQKYYTEKENPFYDSTLCREVHDLYKYFSYPWGEYKCLLNEIKNNNPMVVFKLDVNNIPALHEVIKSDSEGNIHFYIMPEKDEDKERILENLNPFVSSKNAISNLNILSEKEILDGMEFIDLTKSELSNTESEV